MSPFSIDRVLLHHMASLDHNGLTQWPWQNGLSFAEDIYIVLDFEW